MKRLSLIDGQASGVIKKKEEDLNAYKNTVIDYENQIKQRDDQIANLHA